MANSAQLRANTNQHGLKNRISKHKEKLLALSMRNAVKQIVSLYPNIQFKLLLNSGNNRWDYPSFPNLIVEWSKESKLSNVMLVEKLKRMYPDEISKFASVVENGYINPDGSVLMAMFNDEWKIIIASEHKRQGTNDQRIDEGKKEQAMGNAVERAGKNLAFIRSYTHDENITPYVLFAEGCDFHEGSSIRGRIFAMNDGSSFNQINLFTMANGKLRPVSFFVREKSWTEMEMRTVLDEVIVKSLAYYVQKYGNQSTASIIV